MNTTSQGNEVLRAWLVLLGQKDTYVGAAKPMIVEVVYFCAICEKIQSDTILVDKPMFKLDLNLIGVITAELNMKG